MRRNLLSTVFLALLLACNVGESEHPLASTGVPPAERPPDPTSPVCVPAAERLCPTDEGKSDPSFAQFRRELAQAVREKDEAALLARVDSSIRTSFGEGGGIDEFRSVWNPTSAASPLWSELEQILARGGSFRGEREQRLFWAPYVYSSWPEGFDAFQHVAALGSDVVIREQPDDSSAQLAVADHLILQVLSHEADGRDPDWRNVRTPEGVEGWVRSATVRSPIDYRAGFSMRSGQWKMEILVAGD
jgi:hypothetical protein